jgi:hypothetical protein
MADCGASWRFVRARLRWLTNFASASKVDQGRASDPFLLSPLSAGRSYNWQYIRFWMLFDHPNTPQKQAFH